MSVLRQLSPSLLASLLAVASWLTVAPATLAPLPGPQHAEASFPGGNGRIAFSCFEGSLGRYALWTSAADGSDAERLYDDGDSPTWSPDGSTIAFHHRVVDPEFSNQIGLVGADGKGVQRDIARGLQPAWSPDGTEIIYWSTEDDYRGLATRELDGDGYREFFEGLGAQEPSWSPDGKWVAFEGYDGSQYRLFVIPAAGGDPRPVGEAPFYWDWDWAPDGSEIYYTGLANQLRAVKPTGGPSRTVATFTIPGVEAGRHALGAFAVSPDGKKIVAMKQQKGADYGLLFGPITGGHMKEVLFPCEVNPADAPSWQPQSSPSINGTVTRVTCQHTKCERDPLAGVRVTAHSTRGRVSAVTNARGTYRIEGLKPGTYTVTPSKGSGSAALRFVPPTRQVKLGTAAIDDVDFATCGRPSTPTASDSPDPCLTIDVKVKAPHNGSVSAGERANYTVTVSSPTKTSKVVLAGTLPDEKVATVVPGSITGGGKLLAGGITWTMKAAAIKPVKFALQVKKKGLPLDEKTLAVVFTATREKDAAYEEAKLDLMPCGQDPVAYGGFQAVTGSEWSMRAGIDRRFGLVVSNLVLGPLGASKPARPMAERMSVPYLRVQTSALSRLTQFNLEPDSDAPLARSRLLEVQIESASREAKEFEFHATYGIDHLGKKSGSCLLVTQRYQFKHFGALKTCNPLAGFGFLECAQFRPLVEYEFRGAGGERLRKLESTQRLHLDIDHKAKTAALMLDRDAGIGPPIVAEVNPVLVETMAIAIRGGEPGDWDNFHQSADAREVDKPGDFKRGIIRACLDCFHMHWRWGKKLPGQSILGHGNPLIPKGSTQTARVALVKPRAGEEGEPVSRLLDGDAMRGDGLAFYWIAESRDPTDSFYYHWNWAIPATALGAPIPAGEAAGNAALARFVCPVHRGVDEP